MAKVWTYLTVMLGLTLLMKWAGIPTGLDWILNFYGFGDTAINNSTFYTRMLVSIGLITFASIVIGALGRTAPEYAIIAPFAAINVFVLISTFYSVIAYTSNFDTWISYPIRAVMSIFGIGYVWALFSYIFGRDS